MTSAYPCGRVARRKFIFEAGLGFFGTAMGYMWAEQETERSSAPPPPARAKSVIFLFMCGGVSHIDTFDPKDNGLAGKMIEAIA